tara:strand:+ start:278 stop:532 length:255 start_codon:yes stop_codon:yes gene_type:complete
MDYNNITTLFQTLMMKCSTGLKTMSQNPKKLLSSKNFWFIAVPLLVVLVLTFNTLILLVVGILVGRWSTKHIKLRRGENGSSKL